MKHRLAVLAVATVLMPLHGAQAQVQLEDAFPNLRFRVPVDLQHPGDGSDRLFVVEQRGVILAFDNDPGVATARVYLDLTDRTLYGGELGLLGLAFDPEFEQNGYLYVNYTAGDPRRTVIARFQASPPTADTVDRGTQLVLLEVLQPYSNHNAGQLTFGNDGHLYIALGDGGSGGDPLNNGQDRQTLLGSILRIDVDSASAATPYTIPPDNPYVGNTQGYREEIFAYGLRNPWRFSVDRPTGRIWAGDVGQSAREEINIIEKGRNYGWRIMEGTLCYNPASGCDTSGLTLPVWDYGRAEGTSVTGGYVYRGPGVPELAGSYVYGDFGSGKIWSLTLDSLTGPSSQLLLDAPFAVSSFGVDRSGELFVLEYRDPGARIFRFSATTGTREVTLAQIPRVSRLLQNFPNPFNPTTEIPFQLSAPGDVRIDIYDVQGRILASLSEGVLPAGRHRTRWNTTDGRGTPSGTYYYRLTVDGRAVDTRPMVLVR